MQPADYERFRALMNGMGRVFEREIDSPLLDAFWVALGAWALPDFEAAAGTLLRTSKFMPRPADFTALRRRAEPTAGEAWAAVFEGVGAVTDRARRALQIVSGGRALTMMNLAHDIPHVQRRFLEVYEELADVDHIRHELPQLADLNTRTKERHSGLQSLGGVLDHGSVRNLTSRIANRKGV
jgi:hypothetical protein